MNPVLLRYRMHVRRITEPKPYRAFELYAYDETAAWELSERSLPVDETTAALERIPE